VNTIQEAVQRAKAANRLREIGGKLYYRASDGVLRIVEVTQFDPNDQSRPRNSTGHEDTQTRYEQWRSDRNRSGKPVVDSYFSTLVTIPSINDAAAFWQRVNSGGLTDVEQRTSLDVEIDQHRANGHEYLAKLIEGTFKKSAKDVVAAGEFNLGAVRRSLRIWPGFSLESVRAFLDRHQAGDFGLTGSLKDAVLTDDLRFAPELADNPARAALALEQGYGVIKSHYPLDVEGRRDAHVNVHTLVDSAHGNQTIVFSYMNII